MGSVVHEVDEKGMMKKTGRVTIILATVFRAAIAQDTAIEYYGSSDIRYEDHVYADHIRTVTLEKESYRLSDPAIAFGTGEKLVLTFDDLDQQTTDYSYTFIHCTPEWEPTNIPVSYYLKGFTEDLISTYDYSFNTFRSYTHFRLVFPNEYMQPQLPGNYLLKVYETGNPDNPVLTRRWLYYEDRVQVNAAVSRATVIADRYAKHEVDFTIDYTGLPVLNPFEEIRVVLLQNGRWDNAIFNLKPLYIKGNVLDYDYEEGNVFNGGNEFRTFDTRSYRSPNRYMQGFAEDSAGLHAFVNDDRSRAPYQYSILDDINGRFLVAIYDDRDGRLEGEYLHVHFKLLMEEPSADGTPYVFGSMTDWKILPSAQLRYDYEEKAYKTSLYLKQGYYNYMYVMLRDGRPFPDETVFEGNHFEAENDYTVLVYYRPPGSRHTTLAGMRRISSKNIY